MIIEFKIFENLFFNIIRKLNKISGNVNSCEKNS